MATSYKTPGVYVEEISKFPPSIAEVETAIPVFIGYTQKAVTDNGAIPTSTISGVAVSEAKRITSLLEYETYFGKAPLEVNVNIQETYATTISEATLKTRVISNISVNPANTIHTMYYHMQMYFANGGGPCYIISIGNQSGTALAKADFLAGLEMAKRYDEPTLIVFPQITNLPAATGSADAYAVYVEALQQAADLQDRFVIIDCYGDNPDNVRASTGGIGIDNLKYGAVYHPFLRTGVSYYYDTNDLSTFNYTVQQDADDGDFADVGESPVAKTLATLTVPQVSYLKNNLKNAVNLVSGNLGVTLPPAPTMAGVYARVDSTRGVWKAPANVGLAMVNDLTQKVNDLDQASLNVDPIAGKSINAIRIFTGKGIVVWGGRTLAGNDNEWRYVNVRRFCIMVEVSSKYAAGTFVFEPNDANTWAKVQGMLENFLTLQWRAGALQGAKSSDAFYVSVGLNKTMSALDILEGRMIVEIGMAVVRPAEFIILRFSQMMATS